GLLVAHADIGNAFLLRGGRDRCDRKPDDPEQVIDALLFEAPRYQGRAVDFTHASLLARRMTSGATLRIDGRAGKEVCREEMSWIGEIGWPDAARNTIDVLRSAAAGLQGRV